jgi:hypothetical protein
MTNYEKLISYLPSIYQKTNNLKLLQTIASAFDTFDSDLETINKMWLLTEATALYLDVLGKNIGIYRTYNQSDDIFRRRIKVAMYNLYFVPILNNFYTIIEDIMGYSAISVVEGWNYTENPESARIGVQVVVPAGETQDLLNNLENIYSAGVKLDWSQYQETYAVYESFGDLNNTGLADLVKDTERVLVPIGETLYSVHEQSGEQNNTGTTEIYTTNEAI